VSSIVVVSIVFPVTKLERLLVGMEDRKEGKKFPKESAALDVPVDEISGDGLRFT
jgi:hypothetical protein